MPRAVGADSRLCRHMHASSVGFAVDSWDHAGSPAAPRQLRKLSGRWHRWSLRRCFESGMGEGDRALHGSAAALRDENSSLSSLKSGEAMVQIHHGGRWSIVDLTDARKS